MLLVSDEEVLELSLTQYKEFIESAQLSKDTKNTALVKIVGRNISAAVETWMFNNGMQAEIENYSWEFNLVESDTVNAFCMPGGKIAIYTGILPVAEDENGLAVVMGHEVAHAVAKHANERLSQQMAKAYSGSILSVALSVGGVSSGGQALSAMGFEAFSQYAFLLPYSRKHELEADKLGLIFMAMAGYSPEHAEGFWLRMAELGGNTPEFVSTHPSDASRVQQIREFLPEAMVHYNAH